MSLNENAFSRTEMLIGRDALEKLKSSCVAVFGVGGVGGYTVEALARSGVGAIDLIDNDRVSISNINRQIIATNSTVGMYKTEVAASRIIDINPDCKVKTHNVFFSPDTAQDFDFSKFDYVVDAIDTVTGKKQIILSAKAAGVPVISSMGAGNKLDATAFCVADIYETKICPLARVMREICRKNGIESLKVVYSKEPPKKPLDELDKAGGQAAKPIPGSVSFVPSVAGLIIAGEVIKDLIE
ncbi:MAG: tRNA threonylcarbamoyladenosine dehydratase [Clostridia bacterium]|nr:tRNA threonylcarbamoyladenosine dehydratase [Clostridia bacterium]